MSKKVHNQRTLPTLQLKDIAWMRTYGQYSEGIKSTLSTAVSKKRTLVHPSSIKFKSAFKTWIPFCDETTIHGLRFAFGAGPRHQITRSVWTVLFLTMCALGLYMCCKTTSRFLEYKVKTATFFGNSSELIFPAITFTNENLFVKSVVQSSRIFLEGVTTFVAESQNDYKKVFTRVN